MKLKIAALLFILLSVRAFSQIEISTGTYIGGGFFSANSSSVGSFSSSIFFEMNLPIFSEVYPRVSLIYAKDFNAILPNTRKDYYPYLFGASFKGVTTQYFDNKIFLEEGVGLLALNDRTFIDTDIWDYGVVLSVTAGFDLRNFNLKGFKLGAGAEYGITFFNTLPQYSSIHLFVHYTI